MSILGMVLFLSLVFACRRETVTDTTPNEAAAKADLERLSVLTVFFGHQSVGLNIVEGIHDLAATAGGRVPQVRELSSAGAHADGPGLYHFRVGANGDPAGKIRDFGARPFEGVDIALLKLCYVDIDAATDVRAIIHQYSNEIRRLQSKYPATVFVHVTVPIVSDETGPKAFAKRLLGRPRRGFGDNLQRELYNEMLRKEFGGTEPLFDLALFEATDLQGRVNERFLNGERYLSMNPGYTSDGGHLNERGRRFVAKALVALLSNVKIHTFVP
jgi:hypothetical protein